MAICLSLGGTTAYASDSPSNELLVGTVGGIFSVCREKSNEWSVKGKPLEGCHIHALLVEPVSGFIFAGAHKGSIYMSRDSGKTWEHRDQGLTSKDVYCISSVEVEGRVKLYAGTEPAHLFESDDLGEKWSEIPALRSVPSLPKWHFPPKSKEGHVKNVAFDPSNPRTIYASIEQGALLKSKDGGLSWDELHGFDEDVHRVSVRASDPSWLYMVNRMGIHQSRDAGENWEQLKTEPVEIGYPDAFVIHPRREDLMFLAGASGRPPTWLSSRTADSKIARSRDGGQSWEQLREGLPEHLRGNIEAIALETWDGSASLFAGTTDGEVFYSDDEGEHWAKIIEGLPPIAKAHHHLLIR